MLRVNHVGKKIGLLTILEYSHKEYEIAVWKARCDCGKERLIKSSHFNEAIKVKNCKCNNKKPEVRTRKRWTSKRLCRKCNKPLPVTKYFKHDLCTEKSETNYYDIFAEYSCKT